MHHSRANDLAIISQLLHEASGLGAQSLLLDSTYRLTRTFSSQSVSIPVVSNVAPDGRAITNQILGRNIRKTMSTLPPNSTDTDIIEEAKKTIPACSTIEWQHYKDLDEDTPAEEVKAVVIDARTNSQDHVRVYHSKDENRRADEVIVADGTGLKIVLWTSGWRFISMKDHRIGKIC
ncbi:hypothetical protein B0J13DRAFT_165787 [Dactylonectria estremocensis]|uniref:Uncharacterized protein n=1 Tax=Dactylonectria estremocensis TaxID=1079267 RepID=A0A9P9DJJ4_9HYPO|nr:hypothetical protein B0J13DRAFT_165787 [Dactylonectria estremocensis]